MPEDLKKQHRYLRIVIFGVPLPIPYWSIQGFGVLALIAVTVLIWKQLEPQAMISLAEANHAMNVEVTEYSKHIIDTAESSMDSGRISVRVFKDGCLLVQRHVGTKVSTRLLPDPDLMEDKEGKEEHGVPQYKSALELEPVAMAQGQCLNPHPGNFQTAYGQKNGCIVEVWRRFEDSCEHVQLLNACNNSWDSNPDGSPRVRWTRCIH
jgi:hypothetical protein